MQKKFFIGKDVQWFKVFPERLFALGGLDRKVFLGKIKFFGSRSNFVAVKPFLGTGGMTPADFNSLILQLWHSGFPVPKMQAIEHEGKPYVVMERFARKGESKFLENRQGWQRFNSFKLADRPLLERVAKSYATIFNNGFVPSASDTESYLKTRGGEEKHYLLDFHLVGKRGSVDLRSEMAYLYQNGFRALRENPCRALARR